ncbi:uncharacterized protein LOC131935836 [Physella acuta]|uniref:uncharacterized protein LOC131935836 n=1 Tax=Physella acuta TaxID=109671 RepID=UPI0027DCDF90|nr:uncharacterized protein LOC131935836 [Physella acuta]
MPQINDPEILLDLKWLSSEYFKFLPKTKDLEVTSYFDGLMVKLKDLKWEPESNSSQQSELDISGNVGVAYSELYGEVISKVNMAVTPQVSAEVALLHGCIIGLDERTVDLPLEGLPPDIKERTGERWEFQPGKLVSTFTKPGPTFQREVISSKFGSSVSINTDPLVGVSTRTKTISTAATNAEIKSFNSSYIRYFTARIKLRGNVKSVYQDKKSQRQVINTPIHTMIERVKTNMNDGFETCFYEINKLKVSKVLNNKSVSFMIRGQLNIKFKDIDFLQRDYMLW